ncbi:hypothetical protein KC19_6G093000 [Ceratodon purpureus]|uniref:Protein kinase domain-containing protein n=1 Tax=Ceratodon purpureus TaxID=3225 RepID=A0A8T0HCH2_CERPU|nr:hypothetical protein KC19_6G093000 [Ceratodon purpureus]
MAEMVSMDHSSGMPGTQGSREVAAKAGAMERPEYYLALAEGSMEAVQKMSCLLKFNNEQCVYLADKLKVVVQSGSSFLEVLMGRVDGRFSSDDSTGLAEIFKLLVALGKQIESFVEGCCKDAWIQAAMTLTNVSQYVSSLGFNLELCRVAFCADFAVSGCLLSSDEVADINKTEADIVEKKALADKDLLLEKVTQTLISSHGEERDLASSLLRRLMRFGGTFEDETSLSKLFALVEPVEQVGRGASATVYKAKWLGTWVAEKTFEGSENAEFDKEAEILSRLCHPNITSMFCCAKKRRNCSIIMELMDGDLDHLMKRKCDGSADSDCAPFPILEAVDIMDQIGEGVKYLHSEGIVHRDLKSQNILYKKVKAGNLDIGYAHVKVTDFGVSKTRDKSVTNSDLTFNVGTSRWMPPEVIKLAMGSSQTWWFRKTEKAPSYPFKVDSYSFGMVCYEILTGHRPFYAINLEKDVKRRVMEHGERPKLPDDCPLKLRTLIEKCWSQKPTERPTFAEICGELKHLKYLLISGDCMMVQVKSPVSDSIFRFYQPKVTVQLEVVFVHGLVDDNSGDAYWKTWLARDGTPNNVWPMTWLPAEFPFAQVYALKYDASIKQTATDGRMDLFLLGENLVQEMVNFGRIGQNGVPVVFVCHGFGGLVAKQIVVSAKNRFSQDRKAKNLLQNIRGFNFYSTPHRGSVLAEYLHNAKRGGKGSLLENMEVLNTETIRLSEAFEKVKHPSWYIASAAETHATSQDKQMVVEEASSRYEDGNYLALTGKYSDIVRPKAKNDASYLWLINSLREIVRRFEVSFTVREESLVPESFVRLKEQEEAIRRLLQEASIVGVVGMGGIGKTTLAKAVYQSICKDFDRSSYLDDVKSKASLDEVLVTLLQDFGITDCKTDDLKDSRVFLLKVLKKYVRQHKVLVVVDDVGTKENLDRLLKDMGFLTGNKESRLIVTCRNWQVLKEYVPLNHRYDMEFMSSDEDTELFSYHAFQGARSLEEKRRTLHDFLWKDSSEHLMDEFEIVCGDVVRACGGLPLSLEVMGRFLGGYLKDDLSSEECLDCWKTALEKLKNAEPLEWGADNDKLWKVLQISYDALRENEQNMFLDIACFFSESVQYSEQTLVWIWGGKCSKLIELRNLKERCLVKINREDGIVTMHDQLRDMGRCVVRWQGRLKVKKMSRLWDFKDVGELLQSKEIKSEQIEGLSLYGLSLKDGSTRWNDGMEGEPIKTSKQKEHMKYNFNLNCPKMRLLNLLEGDENVIDAINIEGTSSVQWLSLSKSSISKVPIFLQQCKELCVLDMRGCEWLEKLPNTIGKLSNLLELNLCGCISLQRLPDSIGDLVKLSKLDLSYCGGLTCLPESIGKLSNLLELNICGCKGLTRLCDSIGDLVKLSKLDLFFCEGLTCLPECIGKLSNLLEINICGCKGLTRLCDSIGDLVKLSKLDLSYCGGLTCLPESIGKLSNLLELNICGCKGLTRLCDSIGDLVKLSKLDLSFCEGLTCLPECIGKLSNLLELNLCGCISLQRLPDSIGDLVKLSKLDLSYCEGLTCLPESIGKLSNLLELNICGCKGRTRLPDSIRHLVKLSKLDVSYCEGLTCLLECIGKLSNLLEINLCGCISLQRLPDSIGHLVKLFKLDLSYCEGLTCLPESIGKLSNLLELNLRGCKGLTRLPESIGELVKLSNLDLRGCKGLTSLPDCRSHRNVLSSMSRF